jgi:hypothetical protein
MTVFSIVVMRFRTMRMSVLIVVSRDKKFFIFFLCLKKIRRQTASLEVTSWRWDSV